MSTTFKLSAREEAIAQRTAAIVLEQIHAHPPQPELHETVDRFQLQMMLGCKSQTSTYRHATALGLRPYAVGKWRRKAVENAIAKKQAAALQSAKGREAA